MLRVAVVRSLVTGLVTGLIIALAACTGSPTLPSADPASPPPSVVEPPRTPRSEPPPTPDELAGRYVEYVALGDSFTSGPLIAPDDPAGRACGRSLANYPHLLADRLDVRRLRDASCSGANTTHMTQRQDNFFGTNPPQLRALRPTTDLVTLGIGGNDFGLFGQLVTVCAQVRADDPTGSPCRSTLPGVTGLLAETGARVAEVIREIQDRSPKADILLVGYPGLAPDTGTCPDVLPFAAGDYAYARAVQRGLDDALREAAAETGVGFVDVAEASEGNDACAGDDAWVNGRTTVRGKALSYHPLKRGMHGVADLIYEELR